MGRLMEMALSCWGEVGGWHRCVPAIAVPPENPNNLLCFFSQLVHNQHTHNACKFSDRFFH